MYERWEGASEAEFRNQLGFGHGFAIVTRMALIASEVVAPTTAAEGGGESVCVRALGL